MKQLNKDTIVDVYLNYKIAIPYMTYIQMYIKLS